MSTGGSTPGASGSTTTTGGMTTGGMTTGGTGGASGGTGGAAAGTGGTGGGSLLDLGMALDNQTYTLPCGPDAYQNNIRVCCNHPGATPNCTGQCPGNPDLALTGFQNKNQTVKFGGEAGSTYSVKIRVRGIVEPKHYNNCPKQVEGFCGGPNAAPADAGAYNVYMIGVSAPKARYFLNALDETEAHSSYLIDYQATIDIQGGADVQLVAADENCTAIANCREDNQPDTVCNPLTIPDLADHPEINAKPDGQVVVIDVLEVTKK